MNGLLSIPFLDSCSRNLWFSAGRRKRATWPVHKPGSKAGQPLRAMHTRPSGTALLLRSARPQPSSEGDGGDHLFGGFLGIQMQFYETELCFLAYTRTSYSMAKELIFLSCQHSLFFGIRHCGLLELCPSQRRPSFKPIDKLCILVQNEEISRKK